MPREIRHKAAKGKLSDMSTFREAAIEVLRQAKEPLHYKEIARRALEAGLVETDGATPEASMNSRIIVDIKSKGKRSPFVKKSPSTYAINPSWHPEEKEREEPTQEEAAQEEKEALDSGFTGKAGEHRVCSELLFRGFNASIMSVDTGLDIVAVKDGKMFGIQVKTANLNAYDTYVFDIRRASFERHSAGNVFFIFVLRGEKDARFLILPAVELEKKIHDQAIRPVGGGLRYRVNIRLRDADIFLGTKEHSMKFYLDNWGVVK